MTSGSRHIVVAVPAYQWTVHLGTMRSILADTLKAVRRGDQVSILDEQGSTDIEDVRAAIAAQFLEETNGTHLVSIDADVVAPAGAILRLVDSGHDVCGGVYPKRVDPLQFPVTALDGEPSADAGGWRAVDQLPGGFMCVTRAALEKMSAEYPGLRRETSRGKLWTFYDKTFPDGSREAGEDLAFCRRWREMGGAHWAASDLLLGHIGPKMFAGRLDGKG